MICVVGLIVTFHFWTVFLTKLQKLYVSLGVLDVKFKKIKKSEKNFKLGGWVKPQVVFCVCVFLCVFFRFFLIFRFFSLTRPINKDILCPRIGFCLSSTVVCILDT